MTDPVILPAKNSIPGRAYKRRVRNIIIHKPMQREFSFVLIALLMISSLAIGFVIHHTIHSAVFGGGFRFGKVSPYEILSDVSYQLIIRVSCVLFITLIIIGMFGLLFLHRIAGPVYRFRKVLMAVNQGEAPRPIKLREGDFFQETAEEINILLRKSEFEKNKAAKIDEKISKIIDAKAAGSVQAHIKELKEIHAAVFDPSQPESSAGEPK